MHKTLKRPREQKKKKQKCLISRHVLRYLCRVSRGHKPDTDTQSGSATRGTRHEDTQIVAIANGYKPKQARDSYLLAGSGSGSDGHGMVGPIINGDQRRPEADKHTTEVGATCEQAGRRAGRRVGREAGTSKRNDVWPWGRAWVAQANAFYLFTRTPCSHAMTLRGYTDVWEYSKYCLII